MGRAAEMGRGGGWQEGAHSRPSSHRADSTGPSGEGKPPSLRGTFQRPSGTSSFYYLRNQDLIVLQQLRWEVAEY